MSATKAGTDNKQRQKMAALIAGVENAFANVSIAIPLTACRIVICFECQLQFLPLPISIVHKWRKDSVRLSDEVHHGFCFANALVCVRLLFLQVPSV
jgi:hypothetical protein